MPERESFSWSRAALACALGSAVATLFSIAVSQILLGAGLVSLMAGRMRPRIPPIGIPLAGFLAWTFVALACSPEPAAGWPQIRKLYVFSILVLAATAWRELRHAEWMVWLWTAAASASALLGFYQYGRKYYAAASRGEDFYLAYVGDRITGFMSHWMTFSSLQMAVMLMAAALALLGAAPWRRRAALLAGAGLCAVSLVLAQTRSVWIGAAAGGAVLLWCWRRWSVLLIPLAMAAVFAGGGEGVRTRIISLVRPQGQIDSNQHRVVTWRTGVEMVKAHPWVGLGPEMVGREFNDFVPASIQRPLPTGWYGHLHNIYLQTAAERGVPALLFLLWMLGKCFWDWARALARNVAGRWLTAGAMAALTGLCVTGLGEHNIGDSEVLLLFLTVMVMGYLGAGDAERAPDA